MGLRAKRVYCLHTVGGGNKFSRLEMLNRDRTVARGCLSCGAVEWVRDLLAFGDENV